VSGVSGIHDVVRTYSVWRVLSSLLQSFAMQSFDDCTQRQRRLQMENEDQPLLIQCTTDDRINDDITTHLGFIARRTSDAHNDDCRARRRRLHSPARQTTVARNHTSFTYAHYLLLNILVAASCDHDNGGNPNIHAHTTCAHYLITT